VLVTGIQAAGKSTVGRILAERFERGAFVEGDLMWKLIVSGRVDMTPDLDPEAIRQPQLRCRNGAMLVDSLVLARFTAVHADIVLAEDLPRYTKLVRSRPLRICRLDTGCRYRGPS
jgi:adenylate kinase family enzyme